MPLLSAAFQQSLSFVASLQIERSKLWHAKLCLIMSWLVMSSKNMGSAWVLQMSSNMRQASFLETPVHYDMLAPQDLALSKDLLPDA